MMKIKKDLILASNSPRRKQILTDAGFEFVVKVKPTNEDFSETMPVNEVAAYLANKKAEAFLDEIQENQIILTADTVVVINGQILNKPQNHNEAKSMLKLLSGQVHEVITGVCLLQKASKIAFSDIAKVYFNELSDQEIDHYIQVYKPFDKAGSYGVQDFIGMVGIPKIEGSYFTVMGLPIHRIYEELKIQGLIVWE